MAEIQAAFHTISWGTRFKNERELIRALRSIRDAGFRGVEFSQRPDVHHLCVPDYETLEALATRECGLKILGFAGGTLWDRMQFCGDHTDPYLLVYDWDVRFIRCAIKRFTIGLHQRVLTRTSRGRGRCGYWERPRRS
jgi:hypothetical protein